MGPLTKCLQNQLSTTQLLNDNIMKIMSLQRTQIEPGNKRMHNLVTKFQDKNTSLQTDKYNFAIEIAYLDKSKYGESVEYYFR